MLIRCGYELTIRCAQATPIVVLLSVHEDRLHDLRSEEGPSTVPPVPMGDFRDFYGNRGRRLLAPGGDLAIRGGALVQDDGLPDPIFTGLGEVPVPDLPGACLVYLRGSRYCETDLLSQSAWDLFGGLAPGWPRVQGVCDFVHGHLRFDYQKARSTRTAAEAFREGVGVCRDFAHLAITFLRCLNIPARYVSGHLGDIGVPVVDPMDFSAWIEVRLNGGWYTFDPRNSQPRIGRIVLSRGRDAADVPLIHSFGPHLLTSFRVWTDQVGRASSRHPVDPDERERGQAWHSPDPVMSPRQQRP